MLVVQCPLEPTTFVKSLHSKGLCIFEEIEGHISTSNQCHHPPLKDVVLRGSLDGMTPLLLACHFGDFNWVKRIVENWRVDFQAAGVYYYGFPTDPWKIESASPLFVAALNGHLDIVKYLVALGADVSSKTSAEISDHFDGFTPLLGAIRRSHHPDSLAIVNFLLESGADPSALPSTGYPIWTMYSCGLDVITALIQHGLNVNQLNHYYYGETVKILHFWSGRAFRHRSVKDGLPVIKLLVDSGADLMARDEQGFTPILLAAFNRNWIVLDYMLDLVEIDCKEKIDALEMAAAEILRHSFGVSVNYSNDRILEPERAFEYLREALRLRQIGQFHMTPFTLKSGRIIRWTTTAELDQVIEQPDETIPLCYLIQLRICSARSFKAVVSLRHFMSDCISLLEKQNRSIDLLNVLWATLETIQFHQSDSNYEHGLQEMTDDVVENLIWVISQLGKDDPLYIAGTFKAILKVILAVDLAYLSILAELRKQCEGYETSHIDNLFEFFTFLAGLPEEILNEENQVKKQ